MSGHDHIATIAWALGEGEDFARGRYSRVHEWRFDGGARVAASASPGVVPAAFVSESAVDPEEALVAALSSCHMLTFLDLARRAGFVVESYEDEAVGMLQEIAPHRKAVTKVTLRPRIRFSGEPPDQAALDDLHHRSHELCFIANSVTTEIVIETPAQEAGA